MKFEDSEVVFSSGNRRYAYGHIFGIGPDMEVSYGYDGDFYSGESGEDWRDEEDRLTKADMNELADYMIAQWTKFKEQVTDDHIECGE